MATKTESKDVEVVGGLPVFEEPFAALTDFNLPELIAENMGADGLRPTDLTRVGFPRESAFWSIDDPTAANGVKSVPEIVGVPLSQTIIRQFYHAEYSGGNAAPDCFSGDGLTGRPDPQKSNEIVMPDGSYTRYGGACVRCPLNQWGSDLKGGNGKACREYRAIALMEPDGAFPVILRLPPTQLGIWRRFCADVTIMRLRLSQVVVSLGLAVKDKKPVLVPTVRGVLPTETATQIAGMARSMQMLAAPANDTGDFEDDASPFTDDDDGLPF